MPGQEKTVHPLRKEGGTKKINGGQTGKRGKEEIDQPKRI